MFPTTILLATDGTESAGPATRAAANLCAATGSRIELIYVGKEIPGPASYNDPSAKDNEAASHGRELLDGVQREIEAVGGSVVKSHVVPGKSPAEEIVKLTRGREIGLVVVGSRGLGRLAYSVQGSVSSAVVREAGCPVLVVRGDISGL